MANNLPVPAQPAASVVGTSFVNQYYSCLQSSPAHLYRFYMDHSHLTLAVSRESTSDTVAGHGNIKSRFDSLDLENCKAIISSVDSQYTQGNAVLVQVTGTIAHRDAPAAPRAFVQSFVLAPQEKGYYVLNDIVRYTADAADKPPPPAAPPVALAPPLSAAVPPPPPPPAAVQVAEAPAVDAPPPAAPAAAAAEPVAEDGEEEEEGRPPKSYAETLRMKKKLAASAAAAAPPPHPPPPAPPLPLPPPVAGAPAGDEEEGAGPGTPKYDPCSVFVRNVPGAMDEEAVSKLFAQFGRVKHVSLKPQKNSRENDRIAFIDFDSASAAAAAIAASLSPEGRKLAVEIKKVLPMGGPRAPLPGGPRPALGGGLGERGAGPRPGGAPGAPRAVAGGRGVGPSSVGGAAAGRGRGPGGPPGAGRGPGAGVARTLAGPPVRAPPPAPAPGSAPPPRPVTAGAAAAPLPRPPVAKAI